MFVEEFDYEDDDLWPTGDDLTPAAPTWPPARPAAPARNAPPDRVVVILVLLVAAFLVAMKPDSQTGNELPAETGPTAGTTNDTAAIPSVPQATPLVKQPGDVQGGISPLFAPEVRYWEEAIVRWSAAANLDPNIAATIMQIESCGYPTAVSHAGAQGLFQVMPFHFAGGEDSLDPDTNARRGLGYYMEQLQRAGGDVGQAFAGYNGGHRATDGNWSSWADETRRYHRWATGIYQDIQAGLTTSPTLTDWLAAGGDHLCRQAAAWQAGAG